MAGIEFLEVMEGILQWGHFYIVRMVGIEDLDCMVVIFFFLLQ